MNHGLPFQRRDAGGTALDPRPRVCANGDASRRSRPPAGAGPGAGCTRCSSMSTARWRGYSPFNAVQFTGSDRTRLRSGPAPPRSLSRKCGNGPPIAAFWRQRLPRVASGAAGVGVDHEEHRQRLAGPARAPAPRTRRAPPAGAHGTPRARRVAAAGRAGGAHLLQVDVAHLGEERVEHRADLRGGVVVDVQGPRQAGRPVRDLPGAARTPPHGFGDEETGVDQGPDVVQRRRRVPPEPLGDLPVRPRLVEAQPQDPQPQPGGQRPALGVRGRAPRPSSCLQRRGTALTD